MRVPQVEAPGEFSVRGGIVDVFAHSDERPYRIVYDGDNVETVKPFDPATQQSFRAEREATLGLVKRSQFFLAPGEGHSIVDYLGEADGVMFREESELDERARRYLGTIPGVGLEPLAALLKKTAKKHGAVRTHTLPVNESPNRLNLRTLSTQRFSGDLKNILGELQRVASEVRRRGGAPDPRAGRRRRRTRAGDDLRLGLRHLPRRGHLCPRGRRQAPPARRSR